MRRVLNHHYVRVSAAPFVELMSTESVHDIARIDLMSRAAPLIQHLMRARLGINIPFSDLVKAMEYCRRGPIGFCADAQTKDDGPNMETYHEGANRCSRVGHADCCPDAPRERGPNVPGELVIRVERLLTDDKPDQRPKVSGRTYRHEPASSVTDRITMGFSQTSSFTAAFRGNGCMRIFQRRRLPNELSLQAPHLEFSLLPARDTSPDARN